MAETRTPGVGHNVPREADILALMSELRPARDAVEAAQAILKKAKQDEQVVRNKIEQHGFTLSIFDKALKCEREPTNRKGQQSQADEEYLVFKTLGLPTALVQGQLQFGSDEERDSAYWGDQGFQAGIRGDKAEAPDVVPPHLIQHWLNRRAAGVEYSAWGKAEAGGKPDQRAEGETSTIDSARAARDAGEDEPGAEVEDDEGAAPPAEERTRGGRQRGAQAKDPLLQS